MCESGVQKVLRQEYLKTSISGTIDSHDWHNNEKEAIEAGMNDHLAKPVQIEKFCGTKGEE